MTSTNFRRLLLCLQLKASDKEENLDELHCKKFMRLKLEPGQLAPESLLTFLSALLSLKDDLNESTSIVANLLFESEESDKYIEALLRYLKDHYLKHRLSSEHNDKRKEEIVLKFLIEILENRRNVRLKHLQYQIAYHDGIIYDLCDEIYSLLPEQKEDMLNNKFRTDRSKARRLLTFSPNTVNIRPYMAEFLQKDLLIQSSSHPLGLINAICESAFPDFHCFGRNSSPIVTIQQCFDDLLIPLDHQSRKKSDTFFYKNDLCLRPHTSAHQTEFLRLGYEKFLVSGDVYRKDEIDRTHFPVFHQMEGVKLFPPGATQDEVFEDLKSHLSHLTDLLFGSNRNKKWIDAYFPFTEPSLELEIEFGGKFVEVLGCGVIHTKILENCGLNDRKGWAFGLGLERLAMMLFEIPDIRLFWSEDAHFLNQFSKCQEYYERNKRHVKFQSFSKYPSVKREISMWLPETQTRLETNDFFSIVRDIGGESVEEVTHVETYKAKNGRVSELFRITFRSNSKVISKEELQQMMTDITQRCESNLGSVKGK